MGEIKNTVCTDENWSTVVGRGVIRDSVMPGRVDHISGHLLVPYEGREQQITKFELLVHCKNLNPNIFCS